MVRAGANQCEQQAGQPGQRQSEPVRDFHGAPQAMMLRLCQLSTRRARFQRETAPAQILQANPETLQDQGPRIARSLVMLRPAPFTEGHSDMPILASPLPDVRSESPLLPFKLAIALGLAALADWLFYVQRVGLSMALFAVALFVATWLGNLAGFERRRLATAAGVLLVA